MVLVVERKLMRWKDVKVFQEIELGAGRALTQCGLVKSQRQDSVAQNSLESSYFHVHIGDFEFGSLLASVGRI